MKKVLSILLALCMLVGIGVCGATQARAVDANNPTIKEQGKALSILTPLVAYESLVIICNQSELEEYLHQGKTIDDAFITAAKEIYIASIEKYLYNYDLLFEAAANGALTVEVQQATSNLDKLFADYFNTTFLSKCEAFKTVFSQGFSQLLLLIYLIDEKQNEIVNIDIIRADTNALSALFTAYSSQTGLLYTGTLEQNTDFWQDFEIKAKAILDKVVLRDSAEPQKWWEKAPDWVQWILKYLLFGWIWMNLF